MFPNKFLRVQKKKNKIETILSKLEIQEIFLIYNDSMKNQQHT